MYGEEEVRGLAKLLGEPACEALEQFQDWKLQGTPWGKPLERLCIASCTFLRTSWGRSGAPHRHTLKGLRPALLTTTHAACCP